MSLWWHKQYKKIFFSSPLSQTHIHTTAQRDGDCLSTTCWLERGSHHQALAHPSGVNDEARTKNLFLFQIYGEKKWKRAEKCWHLRTFKLEIDICLRGMRFYLWHLTNAIKQVFSLETNTSVRFLANGPLRGHVIWNNVLGKIFDFSSLFLFCILCWYALPCSAIHLLVFTKTWLPKAE